MYIIFDTAIAWYWMPGPDAAFPCYHKIDYVRAYEWQASDEQGSQ